MLHQPLFDRFWKGVSIAVTAAMLLTVPAAAAPTPNIAATAPTRPNQEVPVLLPIVVAPNGTAPAQQESNRELDSFMSKAPSPELAAAIAAFKRADPDASFSFFNGHVDSFATRPKATIPDYAAGVLAGLGISHTAVLPVLLPDLTMAPKPAQNLDLNPSLRFPWSVEGLNTTPGTPDPEDAYNIGDDPTPSTPDIESRQITSAPIEPRDDSWQQPSDRMVDLAKPIAEPVLAAFLAQYPQVFELAPDLLRPAMPSLELKSFQIGRFFQMAKFGQMYGSYPMLEGDLSVLFDINWNIIGLSTIVMDPAKLPVDKTVFVDRPQALEIAIQAAVDISGKPAGEWNLVEFTLGVDPLRRHLVYMVNLVIPASPENDVTVKIDARTGLVLNLSDNVDAFLAEDANGEPKLVAYTLAQEPPTTDAPIQGPLPASASPDASYTDAKVRRWAYVNGNVIQPKQMVTENMYVADNNTLTHDFFYSANDQRTNGTLSTCGALKNRTTWPAEAWTGFDSSTYIRHTYRNDRDFSGWSPGDPSGTFAESDNYFWSRAFFQWLKPALKELGVLPASASNYPKLLMITNTCIDDIGYASGSDFPVTVEGNEGENSRKVRIADMCRPGSVGCFASDIAYGNGSHFASCDGTGCMATPSVIHHEINHYILAQFFGVGSGLDCSSGNQLKFLHEGTMGSVIPAAFWHHYYGVGYAPADNNQLFTANQVRGRVHTSDSTRLTINGLLCTDNGADQGPYNAGRVPSQVLWKMYHGIKVDGSTQTRMARTVNDTDFLIITYWAADMVASSTHKDRYEMANRVMEIFDKYSDVTSNEKAIYCAEWAKHGLRTYINNDYCS